MPRPSPLLLLAALALCCAAAHTALAQDHAGQYTQADVDRGARLYGANCSFCHGTGGDALANADLRSGKFRRAASDEDLRRLIATGIPGTAMPPHKLQDAELTGVVAYIRAMRNIPAVAVGAGDEQRGKAIFTGKGACAGCHRVNGQGSRVAPDLSEIGVFRPPNALQQSLLDPTANMLPLNRTVRAVTREGKTITGRRLNEDTFSVQLIDSEERLLSLSKNTLREYEVFKISSMPSYRDKLSEQELRDVVAYLQTLKGAN